MTYGQLTRSKLALAKREKWQQYEEHKPYVKQERKFLEGVSDQQIESFGYWVSSAILIVFVIVAHFAS